MTRVRYFSETARLPWIIYTGELPAGWPSHERRPEMSAQLGAGVGIRLALQRENEHIIVINWQNDDWAIAAPLRAVDVLLEAALQQASPDKRKIADAQD